MSETNGDGEPTRISPDPCRFCGSSELACISLTNIVEQYELSIHCTNCKACGPLGDACDTPFEAEQSAVLKWNTRATDDTSPNISVPPPKMIIDVFTGE
jgi:hypothetical protein